MLFFSNNHVACLCKLGEFTMAKPPFMHTVALFVHLVLAVLCSPPKHKRKRKC